MLRHKKPWNTNEKYQKSRFENLSDRTDSSFRTDVRIRPSLNVSPPLNEGEEGGGWRNILEAISKGWSGRGEGGQRDVVPRREEEASHRTWGQGRGRGGG